MIDDNGEAVLMDFGSTIKARIHVTTRQQALTQQVKFRCAFANGANQLINLRFRILLPSKVQCHTALQSSLT